MTGMRWPSTVHTAPPIFPLSTPAAAAHSVAMYGAHDAWTVGGVTIQL